MAQYDITFNPALSACSFSCVLLIDLQGFSSIRSVYVAYQQRMWSRAAAYSRLWNQPAPLHAENELHLQSTGHWRWVGHL